VRNLLSFLANIRHVHFNIVNSKHRYCRCLLIKICRPYLFSLFTKICQMKSCQKWNVHFCSFETGLGFRVSVSKKGIINYYFFILLVKKFFSQGQAFYFHMRHPPIHPHSQGLSSCGVGTAFCLQSPQLNNLYYNLYVILWIGVLFCKIIILHK